MHVYSIMLYHQDNPLDHQNPFSLPIASHPTRACLRALYRQTHYDFHTAPRPPAPASLPFSAVFTPTTQYHRSLLVDEDDEQGLTGINAAFVRGKDHLGSKPRLVAKFDQVFARVSSARKLDWRAAKVYRDIDKDVEASPSYYFVRAADRNVAVPELHVRISSYLRLTLSILSASFDY